MEKHFTCTYLEWIVMLWIWLYIWQSVDELNRCNLRWLISLNPFLPWKSFLPQKFRILYLISRRRSYHHNIHTASWEHWCASSSKILYGPGKHRTEVLGIQTPEISWCIFWSEIRHAKVKILTEKSYSFYSLLLLSTLYPLQIIWNIVY